MLNFTLFHYSLITVFTPLVGACVAGILYPWIGNRWAQYASIGGMFVSFFAALMVLNLVVFHNQTFNGTLYTWLSSGQYSFEIGFLIDRLSAIMMSVVTVISLLVHIYSIGYMEGDSGYSRFFAYMSAFTFSMLMLVSSNNFMQLFFGWEGVGVVSYLLIGFWFKRESANQGSLKAFLVNRVGDFGFLLGIAIVISYFGTLDYAQVFEQAPSLAKQTIAVTANHQWSLMSTLCIMLFIGAMGKSAQVPLHVWLPESMEGPTPISALIHAATMVTAGIFMVARMSPLYELSPTALNLILVIGATGALFTGLIAVVNNDIKRIVAYSTLSQLGYMMAGLGASAYAAGMFHLVTHAFFKALLFLGAGSVIIAMHHEQDIQKMGGLRKYLPITYLTVLVGSLALAGLPPLSGFYSKEAIIEAIHHSSLAGSHYAYWCTMVGVFVTALYTFRSFFIVFHTKERMSDKLKNDLHEPRWVVWLPLVLLAIPSAILGAMLADPMLYQGANGLFGNSIHVLPSHDVLAQMATHYHGWFAAVEHSIYTLPFQLAVGGVLTAWLSYIAYPQIPEFFAKRLSFIYNILLKKYGFDEFNDVVFVRGGRRLAGALYQYADNAIIDQRLVDGWGWLATRVAGTVRKTQTGYLYHYAMSMIVGLIAIMIWLYVRL